MRATMLRIGTLVVIFFLTNTLNHLALAKNEKPSKVEEGLFRQLEYPELNVTPRASERLLWEAEREHYRNFQVHIPLQVSGLTTLLAGVLAKGDLSATASASLQRNNKLASELAIIVGGAWTVTTTLMAFYYYPYRTGYGQIRKLPKKNKKDLLLRERLAEETLRHTSDLANRLKIWSVLSNSLTAINLMQYSEGNGRDWAQIAFVASLSPLFIPHHWFQIYDLHLEYKKKIYGPVVRLSPELSISQGKVDLFPMLRTSLSF